MLSRVRNSEFLRHNFVYLTAAVAVGALNYVYYPVLSRLMEPAAFGEIQAITSLFLQAIAYLTVMGLVTVHVVANGKGQSSTNKTVGELEKLATLIAIGVLIAIVVFGQQLTKYFQFESTTPFVLLAVAVVVSVPYMVRSAYVNGKKLFGLNAWSSITAAAGKLILSAMLVALGFGVSGAVFGIVAAQIVALVLAAYFAKRHGFDDLATFKLAWPDMRRLKPELKFAGLVLVGSLSMTILYSVDIIIIKHYFDPYTAGLYASVAAVARIVFFLTAPIAQVLMPSVRLDATSRANTEAFLKSFALLLLVGGSILSVFMLMPEFVVGTLMGGTYKEFAGLLPRLGLAVFIISALNLVTTYYMALRNYAAGVLAASGTIITFLLMNSNHESLSSVVNNLLFGVVLTAWFFAIWTGLKARGTLIRRVWHVLRAQSHSVSRKGVS